MRFSKYNNPNKSRIRVKKSMYSAAYREEQKEELYRLLTDCKTDAERDLLIKAYNATIYG